MNTMKKKIKPFKTIPPKKSTKKMKIELAIIDMRIC